MDHFSRFLNSHVYLEASKHFHLEVRPEAILSTRLFEQLKKLGVPEQKLQTTMQQDNLAGKLSSAAELLKLKGKAMQDYVQDNLWTVEEAYQALVILFDQGEYDRASDMADNLTPCVEVSEKLGHLKNGFLWARLNCKLIAYFRGQSTTSQCIEALKDLLKQEDSIKYNFKQRADLLHAGVLICFLHEDISVFLELFSNEAFLEVVHTIAPYLLYYYAVALIINQQQVGNFNLATVGQSVSKLPKQFHLLLFIEELIVKFSFDTAIKFISNIESEADQDFLLKQRKDNLVNACKLYFFATYIKIFNGVQIKQFSSYLQLNEEQTEAWLVNAIRSLNVSAKIEDDRIVVQKSDINGQNTQLLKQLRDLTPKSNILASNLQRIISMK